MAIGFAVSLSIGFDACVLIGLDRWDLETRHVDCSSCSSIAPLATGWNSLVTLLVLFIGSDVEGDEEKEVGAEDAAARNSGELLSGTLSPVWHPWPVGSCEVIVRCEVDEAWST